MTSTASALANSMEQFETPEAVVGERLAMAREVAAREPVVSALVVGSTALRRCSSRADLDVVLIADSWHGIDRFQSSVIRGVRVEMERLETAEVLALTAGDGWIWELRDAARIGCGVPVIDTGGWAGRLARRAAAMRPFPDRVESTLRDLYLALLHLRRGSDRPEVRMEALRGCLDNVALLALLERPRRYQKAKWALADLLHAGEIGLVDALLAAYGIVAADASPALEEVHDLLRRTYEVAGLPAHGDILAMGHTPQYAEASYVSRCLDDAVDLAASGRHVEANYVALFTARLAAGLLGDGAGVLDAFGPELAPQYLALFPAAEDPGDDLLEAALAATDARRAA